MGRKRSGHGHTRQRVTQRQHGLYTLASSEHVVHHAEANSVAKQVPHGPPWRVDRSLAEPDAIKAVWIEPGAVHAGDPSIEVGDAGYHRRPGFSRQMIVRPIVATWVEAEAATMVDVGYSATLQIRLDHRPFDRAGHRKEPTARLLRSGRRKRTNGRRRKLLLKTRQLQKAPGLLGDLAEIAQPP